MMIRINFSVLYIILLLHTFNVNAQENKEDFTLFDKGNALYSLVYHDINFDNAIDMLDSTNYENQIEIKLLKKQKEEILEIALEYFENLIHEYPESDLIYRAQNNAAIILHQLDYIDLAIEYYLNIINGNANDQEPNGGEGMMAEPYALYKNRACKSLAEIYLNRKNYKEALKYINLTKKYPYQHFCGNEHVANSIYIATLYTKSHYGLNDIEKALSFALPNVLNYPITSNTYLLNYALTILKSNYSKEQLSLELKKSLKNIKLKKEKSNEITFTTFLGIELEISYFSFDSNFSDNLEKYFELSEIEKGTYHYKNSEFYIELFKYCSN